MFLWDIFFALAINSLTYIVDWYDISDKAKRNGASKFRRDIYQKRNWAIKIDSTGFKKYNAKSLFTKKVTSTKFKTFRIRFFKYGAGRSVLNYFKEQPSLLWLYFHSNEGLVKVGIEKIYNFIWIILCCSFIESSVPGKWFSMNYNSIWRKWVFS